MKYRSPLTVEVTRAGTVESRHQVMLVVVDEKGQELNSWGDRDYPTFPRSSIKPLQAIPFVESGAIEKFNLDDSCIVLACASHAGEKHQTDLAQAWLNKIHLQENALWCGPCYPNHEGTLFEMIRQGRGPASIINNCSGKHLGIISTCLVHGEDYHGYHQWDHPAQKRLRQVLSEAGKFDLEKAPYGVDGCAIPTYCVPLSSMALATSAFFRLNEFSEVRASALKRILKAWQRYPDLIGDSTGFAVKLNQKTQGRSLLKPGAEGAYCGLIPEKGISFALKAVDGNRRAAEAVSAMVFKYYGGLTENEFQDLKQWTEPSLKNTRGDVVGGIQIAAQ